MVASSQKTTEQQTLTAPNIPTQGMVVGVRIPLNMTGTSDTLPLNPKKFDDHRHSGKQKK